MKKRHGFTLIELLVVIAIIGILAAMLFPVFARARESARKTQCLANVKNIAIAAQLYLTEYDRFWPSGAHDAQAQALCDVDYGCTERLCSLEDYNPYNRLPVILDEYTKNRDVWRCPSARMEAGQGHGWGINSCTPSWFAVAQQVQADGGPCPVLSGAFPPGWGGSVTDTYTQGLCSGDGGPNAFKQSIDSPCNLREMSLSQAHDVSKLVVCGDAGWTAGGSQGSNWGSAYAYPDYRIPVWMLSPPGTCDGHYGKGTCAPSDDCPDSDNAAQCGPQNTCYGGDARLVKDSSYRHTFARHLGGSNLGFADGHAKWYPADQVMLGGYDHTRNGIHPQFLYGLCICVNLTATDRNDLPEWTDSGAALF
jgi:prepilin-type N-terminal cleavage/methylation domain-containing protein/prepilin-type processing-associated H-X9-DG protein